MNVIGLTGGSGSGKTTVLNLLRDRGAAAIDCDRLYDSLLQTSEALRADLVKTFGQVFLPDGSLDRKTLSETVFSDPKQLLKLNAIVYYHVGIAVREELAAAKKSGKKLAVIDAVNLIESGLGELCDTTVAVLAPLDTRIARIMARDGIDRAQAEKRIAAQQTDETFTARAKQTLINDGSEQTLCENALSLLAEYLN
ncbi:MAG: dephospho-CoA kinase [Oscillospiraceae bacterium]|nr:dephospho-CoA kinase [Oscillospiraceae bacterium]